MSRSVSKELSELAREMRRLAKQAPKAVSRALGDTSHGLVVRGFDEAHAPSGASWAPLKDGAGRPLDDTGALRRSVRLETKRLGFRLTSDTPYGAYHQEGTRTVPARPFLPEEQLSPGFERALEAAADRALEDLLK